LDAITNTELVGLKKMYATLRDGMAPRESFFDVGSDVKGSDRMPGAPKAADPEPSMNPVTGEYPDNNAPNPEDFEPIPKECYQEPAPPQEPAKRRSASKMP